MGILLNYTNRASSMAGPVMTNLNLLAHRMELGKIRRIRGHI